MFSMQDIIKLMGPNTASYIQMGDQLGTLEAGKLADIIMVDGNPLDGYWNMLKTKVVLKSGKVVVDKRVRDKEAGLMKLDTVFAEERRMAAAARARTVLSSTTTGRPARC